MASTSDFCILIAEDDAFLRQATARTLRKQGYVVIEAADGSERFGLPITISPTPSTCSFLT